MPLRTIIGLSTMAPPMPTTALSAPTQTLEEATQCNRGSYMSQQAQPSSRRCSCGSSFSALARVLSCWWVTGHMNERRSGASLGDGSGAGSVQEARRSLIELDVREALSLRILAAPVLEFHGHGLVDELVHVIEGLGIVPLIGEGTCVGTVGGEQQVGALLDPPRQPILGKEAQPQELLDLQALLQGCPGVVIGPWPEPGIAAHAELDDLPAAVGALGTEDVDAGGPIVLDSIQELGGERRQPIRCRRLLAFHQDLAEPL